MVFVPHCSIVNYNNKHMCQARSLAFHQLQAQPMFARFHYSIRPKAIGPTILLNLGGHAITLAAKLEYPVLKPTSASEIQQR
jgi:hypothetical protein